MASLPKKRMTHNTRAVGSDVRPFSLKKLGASKHETLWLVDTGDGTPNSHANLGGYHSEHCPPAIETKRACWLQQTRSTNHEVVDFMQDSLSKWIKESGCATCLDATIVVLNSRRLPAKATSPKHRTLVLHRPFNCTGSEVLSPKTLPTALHDSASPSWNEQSKQSTSSSCLPFLLEFLAHMNMTKTSTRVMGTHASLKSIQMPHDA